MRRSELLYRRIFPSHVSWKEAARFALASAGLEIRLLSSHRVKGIRQLDDVRAVVGDQQEPTFFDVGAHIGETLFKMRNLYARCRVHAFEPSPVAFGRLRAGWAGTPGVWLSDAALGEREMTAPFNEYEGGGSAANSLLSIDRASPSLVRDAPLNERISVQVGTVDSYCERQGIEHIDWLKIDTQGYDLRVLHGARALLKRHAIGVISLEVNLLPMYEGEGTLGEILAFCETLGYFAMGFYDFNYVGARLGCCDVCFVPGTAPPVPAPADSPR